MLEHRGERADGDILHIVAQQTRIGIRNDQADNQDREDVKQQDTPEDWRTARGMFFSGFSDSPAAMPISSVPRNEKPTIIATPIIAEKPPANGASAIPSCSSRLAAPFEDADNHHHADDDKDNDGGYLYQREPVFRLAKAAHRDPVQQEHDAEE